MQPAERLLVTGAAGFFGSSFVRYLLDRSAAFVISLDSLAAGECPRLLDKNLGHERHHFLCGHVDDTGLIQRILREFSVTGVVNFAAETGVDRSIGDPLRFVENNVCSTTRLLDGVLGYWDRLHAWDRRNFRFVQGSTIEVYGSVECGIRLAENAVLAPSSPYAASRAAADVITQTYHRTYGLPTLVARSTTPYGPDQQAEKLIPRTTLRGLTEHPVPLYGDGLHQRDWLHIQDLCSGLDRLLKLGIPGETYNFGSGIPRSNLHVVTAIFRILDELQPVEFSRDSLVEFVNDRPGHDRYRISDSTKARKELGWVPTIPFEAGLRDAVGEISCNITQGLAAKAGNTIPVGDPGERQFSN